MPELMATTTNMLSSADHELQALVRHTERRRQGIPTVTVFVGPVGSALQLWRRTTSSANANVVLERESALLPVLISWLTKAQQKCDVRRRIAEFVADQTQRSAGELLTTLSGKSDHEIRTFLEHTLPDEKPPGINWLCRLLVPLVASGVPTEEILTSSLPADVAACTHTAIDLVASLLELFPSNELPTLLLLGTADAPDSNWLAQAARSLARLAIAVPQLPIALTADPKAIDDYLLAKTDSKTRAIFREGVIQVTAPSEKLIRERIASIAAPNSPRVEAAINDLTRHGGSDESLALLTRVVSSIIKADSNADNLGDARSWAERFLFDRLQSHPLTVGMFELNQKVPSKCADVGLMEIDIFARSLGIAIEIDGHYHFLNPDAYRRDRRKDFAMQQCGHFVLRWLATDVVERLEEIFERIAEAIEIQHRRRPKPGELNE